MVGPGIDRDTVPTPLDHAAGKERIEFVSLAEGKDPYYGLMDNIFVGAKGTKTNPIEVLSPDEDRIIGCQGAHQQEGGDEQAMRGNIISPCGFW
jgi:hypothetical protein